MSTSDTITAKAEARRLKIIANSQKRLARVLGMSEENVVSLQPKMSSDAGPSINNVSSHFTDSIDPLFIQDNDCIPTQSPKELEDILYKIQKHFKADSENEDNTVLTNHKNPSNITWSSADQTLLQKVQEEFQTSSHALTLDKKTTLVCHLIYVVLAVLVRLLIHIQCGYIFGEMIIVPFLLTQSIQISLGYIHNTSSIIQQLSQLTVLVGLSPKTIHFFVKLSGILIHFIEDYNLYFVSFCIAHSILQHKIL